MVRNILTIGYLLYICAKKKEYEKSVFLLNKEDLVQNYNNFKFAQIKQRGESLAVMATKIWKF